MCSRPGCAVSTIAPILPNSQIATAEIINYSMLPLRRMEVSVGVGYSDDLKLARTLLLQIACDNTLIVDDLHSGGA